MNEQVKKPLAGNRIQVISREMDEDSRPVARARVEGQMPHDRYHARGYITDRQHATAQDVLRLYDRGKWVELQAASMEEHIKGGSRAPMTDDAVDARKRLKQLLARLDLAGADMVWKVVLEGWDVTAWAHYYGVDRNGAMGRFREALDVLGNWALSQFENGRG